MTILVTGGAGFIGYHLIRRLLNEANDKMHIVAVDSLNEYYDVALKEWRLNELESFSQETKHCTYTFLQGNLADKVFVRNVFNDYHPNIVVHLAAQAGTRASIEHPDDYIESNIIAFYNMLEACRNEDNLEHFVYASSSSVYGGNKKIPFSTDDKTDEPVSLYAATKKSDELLAHAYSKLYDIPMTGLRFFTVYGPAGRPDMAYYKFADKLRKGDMIELYNYGKCRRDFTYVDDIVEGICRVMNSPPKRLSGEDGLPIPPYIIYNIGGGTPVELMEFVKVLSEELISAGLLSKDFDIESRTRLVPMQPGDVPLTYADSKKLEEDFGFVPEIDLRTGLREFARWYAEYNEN